VLKLLDLIAALKAKLLCLDLKLCRILGVNGRKCAVESVKESATETEEEGAFEICEEGALVEEEGVVDAAIWMIVAIVVALRRYSPLNLRSMFVLTSQLGKK
jgi:hypothetical protein